MTAGVENINNMKKNTKHPHHRQMCQLSMSAESNVVAKNKITSATIPEHRSAYLVVHIT